MTTTNDPQQQPALACNCSRPSLPHKPWCESIRPPLEKGQHGYWCEKKWGGTQCAPNCQP